MFSKRNKKNMIKVSQKDFRCVKKIVRGNHLFVEKERW